MYNNKKEEFLPFKSKTLLVVLLLFIINVTHQISFEEFVSLSHAQKLRLDEFRTSVSPKLSHEYMKQDVYLIRWLRDKDFDVKAAEKRLFDHLKWREENQMDTIRDEDWSDFDQEYPVSIEGCSKDHGPIISIPVGDWDFRRAVVTGKTERMMRYISKMYEDGSLLIRSMAGSGQNTTQGIILYDMANFNAVQHLCPGGCFRIYIHMLQTTDHYPGIVHRLIAVNLPEWALPMWDVMRHFMPRHIQETVTLYGKSRPMWEAELGKEIGPDQLTRRFGGSRPEAIPAEEMRSINKTFVCYHDYPPSEDLLLQLKNSIR